MFYVFSYDLKVLFIINCIDFKIKVCSIEKIRILIELEVYLRRNYIFFEV